MGRSSDAVGSGRQGNPDPGPRLKVAVHRGGSPPSGERLFDTPPWSIPVSDEIGSLALARTRELEVDK